LNEATIIEEISSRARLGICSVNLGPYHHPILHSYESSQHEQAIFVLEPALEKQLGNQDIISALASYYQQQGNEEKLQELIQKYSQ